MEVDLTQMIAAAGKRMHGAQPTNMAVSQKMLDAFAKTLTDTQDRYQGNDSFADRSSDDRSQEHDISERDVVNRHHDSRDNDGHETSSRDRGNRDADTKDNVNRASNHQGSDDQASEKAEAANDKTSAPITADTNTGDPAASLDAADMALASAHSQSTIADQGATLEADGQNMLALTTAAASDVHGLTYIDMVSNSDTGLETIINGVPTDGTDVTSQGLATSAQNSLKNATATVASGGQKNADLGAAGPLDGHANQQQSSTTVPTQAADLLAAQATPNPNAVARQLIGNANAQQAGFQPLTGNQNLNWQAAAQDQVAAQTMPSNVAAKSSLATLQYSLSQNSSHPQTGVQMLAADQTGGKQATTMPQAINGLQANSADSSHAAASGPATSSQNPTHAQASLHMLAVEQNAMRQSTAYAQPFSSPAANNATVNPNTTAAQLTVGQDTQSSTQMLATAQNTAKKANAAAISSTAELTAATAQVRRASAGNPSAASGAAAPKVAEIASTTSSLGSASVAAPVAGMSTAASLTASPFNSMLKIGPSQAPQVIKQVTVEIANGVKKGDTDIKIQLRPDQLGKVEVKLEVAKDGLVRAMVLVDKAETLELLQRDSRGLERSLLDAGLKTGSGSLNFALNDQSQSGSGQSSQGQNGGRKAHGGAAHSETTATGVEMHDDQAEQPTIGADGMINMVA